MRPTLAHCLVVLQALLFLGSCGAGQRHAYQQVEVNLPLVGSGSASVLAVDRRPAVVRGEREPSFVGSYRTDERAASLVRTDTGNAFAEDVAAVVSRALGRSGYNVQTLEAGAGLAEELAFQELRQSGADHLILIDIREWQTETFKNTQLVYRLELSVFNTAGALKGKSSVAGSDQLAESHADSDQAVEDAVRRALDHKLRLLFAEPKVIEAFQRQH